MFFSSLRHKKTPSVSSGFTIVELLVAILIGSILSTGVVSVFIHQTRAVALQEDLVELQQNLRIGMDLISRDVRMAGAFVKETMPVFVIGPFNYYHGVANAPIPLDSNGNPDSVMLNYSIDPGLNTTNGTSTSNSMKVCNDDGIPIDQLYDGNKLPVSNNGKSQLIEITNLTPVGGNCFNVVFSPGQSPVNNSTGAGFALTPGGKFWPNIQSVVFFIDLDADGSGTPGLMRGANNSAPAVVAFGINDMDVTYVLEDGTDTLNPTPIDVRSVRLTISGETRNAHGFFGSSSKKRRTMTTEILVRNLAI